MLPSFFRTLLIYTGIIGIVGIGALVFIPTLSTYTQSLWSTATVQTANVSFRELPAVKSIVETKIETSDESTGYTPIIPQPPTAPISLPPTPPKAKDKQTSVVTRISNPYPFPPQPFVQVNERARTALVNILCTSDNASLRPISGSGVIIDSRGVILTNSHIAQYVLLSQSPEIDLSCVVRSGSPARSAWSAKVLYIPPVWIEKHATDITNNNPTGTGENDYALLRITDSHYPQASNLYGNNYPALPYDTREAISFPGDPMLIIAYPAEFIGSLATQFDLHPVSSITPIGELLTFHARTVDLVAFKGAAEAQSGSSGGPIVNSWGYITGIITTTSDGATTAERELRAITTSYIDRDLTSRTGAGLAAILNGDLEATADYFKANHAPILTKLLVDQISKR